MIVPQTKGPVDDTGAPIAMPSQTNLLMALAEMHKQGRFQTAQQNMPEIEYEDKQTPNIGSNFEGLYKQLEGLKSKVKSGNVLRLYDKDGNDFYYQRDDNFEHGYGWYPKPPDKTS